MIQYLTLSCDFTKRTAQWVTMAANFNGCHKQKNIDRSI